MPTFLRPSWEDAVIVVAAVVVFAFVQLSGGGEEAADAPATTATPSPAARSSAVQPTPTPVATPTPAPAARDPDACDFSDVRDRVWGAVVQVFAGTNLDRQMEAAWSGTGFHIGGGRYVTAAHVIQDDDGNRLPDILIQSWAEGEDLPATVVQEGSFSQRRTERDLATLHADPIGHALVTRTPATSDITRDVRAIGYPWSRRSDAPDPHHSGGEVSAVTTSDGIAIVQVDARVQQGMSGGPLVDECGAALGVASFVPLRSDDSGGAQQGFAVFISIAELANLR